MVCFCAVGFALSIIVVLEFGSACWAVCDAHGLGSCEYLFSELFVFSGACSAHCCSLLFSVLFVLGGGASQRQRDERLHRLTLLSASPPPPFFSSSFWCGGCRVVRAQLCEHARNTTRASYVCLLLNVRDCVSLLSQHTPCCLHHTLFTVNDRHVHH